LEIIPILLNVRTLSVVEVFCHLDYCSKTFEKSSKTFEKSSKTFEKSSTTYYLKLLNFGIIIILKGMKFTLDLFFVKFKKDLIFCGEI
jgi:hypothetical protein